MIDLHLHLLPGLDDGPPTLERAVAMARDAAAAGTTKIVATPHIDERWAISTAVIAPAIQELQDALRAAGVSIDVVGGGEVSIGRLMRLSERDRAEVGLGAGPYVLVEMPHAKGIIGFERNLLSRLEAGERLVLAHPERCPAIQRRPAILSSLVAAGAVCSVTAGSLAGQFGENVRRFSAGLLEAGLVHNVASDAHDTDRRPPGIGAVPVATTTSPADQLELRAWLTVGVPAAVLAGEPIPPRPVAARAPIGEE